MNRRWISAAVFGLWATINNTTLAAVNVCDEASLRAAVAGGGNITFNCDGTIVLSSPLVITQNVTLNATGHNVTISGNDQVRIFEVGYGFSLHLINLTISHGLAQGTNGAPRQPGGNADGGAVWCSNLGTFRAKDCRFFNNRAVGGAGGDAILGPPGSGGFARGGAIFGTSAIYLTNCVFTANSVEGGSGGGPEPGGAPIHGQPGDSHGGAILSLNGPVTVQNCTFTSNAAATTGGAMNSWISQVNISNSVFVANTAAYGGALFSQANPPLAVSHSVFAGNSASGQGGAIAAAALNLSKSYFVSNSVSGKPATLQPNPTPGGSASGGALSLGAGEIVDCTFQHNIARGGDGLNSPSLNAGSGTGGAIHTAGGVRTTVRNSTFVHNVASSGVGQRFDAGAVGGALACVSGELRIEYSTIASNAAVSFTNSAYGGGVAQFAGGALALVYLYDSILSGNTTNGAFGDNAHPAFMNGGNNVSSDGTPVSGLTTNNVDPRIGPLVDNGGPVPTMALLTGSPALNFGQPNLCPPADARGVLRPQDGACDAGAFEQTFMRLRTLPNLDVEVSYLGVPNERYIIAYSFNLIDWQDTDAPLLGGPMTWGFPGTALSVFFRVKLLP
jgi:predicted outer membrane repeat protein